MKKYYFLILFFATTLTSVNAQIKKGSVFLGGNLSLSLQQTTNSGNNYYKRNSFYVAPVYGKAIKDNLVVGGEIDLGFGMSGGISSDFNSHQNDYGAGLFVRKYKPIGKSGFCIFLQGSFNAGVDNTKSTETTYPEYEKITTLHAGFSAYPGVSLAVSKRLQLESGFSNLLYLNFSHENRDVGNPLTNYKTNSLSLGASLNNLSNIYVGFRLLISK